MSSGKSGVHYPKGSAHPSMSVGEQDSTTWPEDGDKTRYRNTSVSDTVYNGHRVHTKKTEGGSGSPNKADYPKSRVSFGTEKHVGS